jgi:hypothetical protein
MPSQGLLSLQCGLHYRFRPENSQFKFEHPDLLSAMMPAPSADAFTLSSPTLSSLACSVQTVDGTYKLNCGTTPALASSANYELTYGYNNADPLNGTRNDYYMCDGCTVPPSSYSNKFTIATKQASQVAIGGMYGIKVVERTT